MRVHLIGVCGTAMAGVASMLKQSGLEVQGSDPAAYPPMSDLLRSQGIGILEGYSAGHITPGLDLVVVGNVARRDNPEVLEAQRLGLRLLSMPQVIRQMFLTRKTSLTVAGTHGKTTTTAIVAHVMNAAGLDPSFLVGGIPLNFGTNFRLGAGPHFVIEGDEYDTAFFDKKAKFFHYDPTFALITSLEYDHADIYPDFPTLVRTFEEFAALVHEDGALVTCADYPVLDDVGSHGKARVVRYGFSGRADYRIGSGEAGPEGLKFGLTAGGKSHTVRIPLWGRHNALNAAGAFALLAQAGLPPERILDGLATFQGVRRRQQVLDATAGITIVDDFAHHPTAVRETIAAVRSRFPGRRLFAAFHFESNTSRRKVFEKEYAQAFRGADHVFLSYPLKKKDDLRPEDYLDPAAVMAGIGGYAESAEAFEDMADMAAAADSKLRPGDVVLGMSGRDFGPFYQTLSTLLRKRS
jgi:UDP-N-acetylmuramate: L-alanyl-gamma-D-glutamyl-meso-diaminopimelate ligase